METPQHTFNLFNRDQSTPLLEPDKWNADTLVIDAWKKNIYIKGEFIPQYYNTHINSKGQFISILKHKKLISIKTFKTPIKK
jgi:hypothetical protein